MKTAVLLIILQFFFSYSVAAEVLYGAVDGGGGRAVVCKDSSDEIVSVESLDLYEARVQYGLTLEPEEQDLDTMLIKVGSKLEHLGQGSRNQFLVNKTDIDRTFSKWRLLPPGTRLKPVDDSHEVLVPAGCEIVQIANYKNQNTVLIVSDLWEKMSPLNQAALVFHESIYYWARFLGAEDSQRVRKVVGYLFSTEVLERVYDGLPPYGETLFCSSKDPELEFYVRKECEIKEECKSIIQFVKMGPLTAYSKTVMSLPIIFYDTISGEGEFPENMSKYGTSGVVHSKIHYDFLHGFSLYVDRNSDSEYQYVKVTARLPFGIGEFDVGCFKEEAFENGGISRGPIRIP